MRASTIPEYIQAAPREDQPHLQRLYAILKSVAPEAQEAIKWGNPFFIEPQFLFAFSAHKPPKISCRFPMTNYCQS